MVGFSGTLGTGQEDDEREINGWKKTLSRFRGKLVKMIRDADSKFDDYSFLPKILSNWGYELTKKNFFNGLTN